MGHGSNGSTFLDGSHGSWVSTRDPLTHVGLANSNNNIFIVWLLWDNQSWTPCRESPMGQNPSILKWGKNSRGWVKISWGKSKGEPLLGVTPCPHLPSLEEIHLPVFFRYLADKREMPYLTMLRKVEKWSRSGIQSTPKCYHIQMVTPAPSYQVWSTSMNTFVS